MGVCVADVVSLSSLNIRRGTESDGGMLKWFHTHTHRGFRRFHWFKMLTQIMKTGTEILIDSLPSSHLNKSFHTWIEHKNQKEGNNIMFQLHNITLCSMTVCVENISDIRSVLLERFTKYFAIS